MDNTILLVEDNDDNRAIYQAILTYGGFQVIEAVDGEDGIERARRDQPVLILMDIAIPKIDGWAATRALKRDASTRHIPIVALTAYATPDDRMRASEAGCDGYLAKPIEPRRVLEEVQRLLEEGTHPQHGLRARG